MITTNSFIFSWDEFGIEAIIPLNEYKDIEKNNLLELLKGNKPKSSGLGNIVRNLIMRAHINSQRFYEVYAIECSEELDETFWKKYWEENPQLSAKIVREYGYKLYSNRRTSKQVIT